MDFEEEEVEGEAGATKTIHTFRYACPCGDRFRITLQDIWKNRTTAEQRELCIAICPSCSLQIRVIFDEESIEDFIKEQGLEEVVANM